MDNLTLGIEREGQQYVDEPVKVRPQQRSAIELSVAAAFGNKGGPQTITIGHQRVRLRWMKPDGKGGLVPR